MLKNNLLVFSSSRAIRYYISQIKQNDQLLDKTITIGDFFSLASIDKNRRTFIDKNLRVLFLRDSVTNEDIKKLGLTLDFSTFLKQSENIVKFFTELSYENVSFDQLLMVDTYTKYSDHLEVMKTIFENYKIKLQQYNLTDNIFLPYSFEINKSFISQYEEITVNIDGYLSGYELKILEEISKIVQLNINISINQYNRKYIQLLKVNDHLEVDYNYNIDFSNKKVVAKYKDISKKQDIVISPVNSSVEQIAFIKYQISRFVQAGIEAEKIALITPDESFVNLLERFDTEKYFNYAMGRGITSCRFYKILTLISKLMIDQEPKDLIKLYYYELDSDNLEQTFFKNWDKLITIDMFNSVFDFIYAKESNEEIKQLVETLKISLEILIFNKTVSQDIKFKEFFKILLTQLSSITIDDTQGGKITVLGILETRSVQYDAIIICDFNDEKIPKTSTKDKFISSKLKEFVKLPTISDRENLQRYYYKKILDGAKYVAISYIDDDVSVMSRFISDIYPNYKEYLVDQNYKDIMYKNSTLNKNESDIVLDIDLSLLKWSATALKSYLTCKRKYYFSYIKNIKDHKISLKPQSFEIGNIIHNCLEKAVKQNSLNIEFINSYLGSYQKSNPYLILELELWKKKMVDFIAYENVRKENGIVIDKVELPFEFKYNGILIKGKIDRVDRYSDGSFQILDYKTSSSLKIDTIKNYEKSTDFQLEFYYLALRDKEIKDVSYYELNTNTIKSEIVLKEKLILLENHFKSLRTKQVNFKKTEEVSNCQFCPYKDICF